MTFELAVTLVPSAAILFLGIIVLFHGRKSTSNLFFFLITIANLLWAFANYFSITAGPGDTLFWIRWVLFFAVPHTTLLLLFVLNFPNSSLRIKKVYVAAVFLISVVAMFSTISPHVYTDIVMTDNVTVPTPGYLMPIFALTIVGSLALAFFTMIRKYLSAKREQREQWWVMLFGTSLSYISLILTNFLFVLVQQDTSYNIIGSLLMLPLFFGMTYAILRHNVLNVKTIGVELLTFVILAISAFEIFLADSAEEVAFKILIFVLFFGFGVLLIRSVLNEVRQREQIEVLAQNLQKANERLKELDRLKSEFVSIASHQLRSPLTAIKGYASLILEGSFGDVTPSVKEAIQKIYDSSALMTISVQDFLDVSRIEQGRMKYNFEKFDIEKLLTTVVEELTPIAKEKNLELHLRIDPSNEPYLVNADLGKIKQVLSNLIDNSIKYTPKGSITAVMCRLDGNINVEIRDTGVGISKETLPKLFDKFVRSRNAHHVNVSGTGLGLYVVKQMVKEHRGRVWATSEGEGKGSIFHVRLPEA